MQEQIEQRRLTPRQNEMEAFTIIQLDIMIMGAPNRTLRFEDTQKSTARREYCKYEKSLSCYPLLTVDGRQLNTHQAHSFLGIRYRNRHRKRNKGDFS